MTRMHLEMEAYEASLTDDQFDEIVAAHPSTIAQQEVGIELPDFSLGSVHRELTYLQAMEYLVRLIAEDYMPSTETAMKLNRLGADLFTADSPDALAGDLIVAVLVIRNQSLPHLYDENIATAIHARAVLALQNVFDRLLPSLSRLPELTAVYDEFLRAWMTALGELDPPHLAIASRVLHRSADRTGNSRLRGNPVLECLLACILLPTCFCAWHSISEEVTLLQD